MTYVTHPVRRIRDHPDSATTVALLVTAADDAARLDVASALADVGTVEDRLSFGTVRATVPQTAVDAVCDLDDVERVETANTLELDPTGAGEDVELDG